MVSHLIVGFGLFLIRPLDGSEDPLSAVAGVGILAVLALGLIALLAWLWSRAD
ncbi:MAG: hypothetical protein ABIK89_16335 [Planctomycetota bacterium]